MLKTELNTQDILKAIKAYLELLSSQSEKPEPVSDYVKTDIPCEICKSALFLGRNKNSWYEFKCRSC